MPSVASARKSFTPILDAPDALKPRESSQIPQKGDLIDLYLPAEPEVGKAPKAKRRRIRVERVRDLAVEPFTITEFLETPMMRFGRYIVIGRDVRTKLGVWAALDWQQPRELAVYHSDNEPAHIYSGRSRFERLCFLDTLGQLSVEPGFRIGLRDFPPVGDAGADEDDWGDDVVIGLGPEAKEGATACTR